MPARSLLYTRAGETGKRLGRVAGRLVCDFGLRCLIMLAVLIPWYLLEWGFAVRLTAYSTATALWPFCEATLTAGGSGLLCDGRAFVFTKECTYLDLFLASAPFVWRSHQRRAVNLRRIVVVFSLIWLINMLRLVGSLAAYVHGVQWKLAHNVPDMLLYWPFLGIVLLSYWRSVASPDALGRTTHRPALADRRLQVSEVPDLNGR